jgi:hypothetical protein
MIEFESIDLLKPSRLQKDEDIDMVGEKKRLMIACVH